MNRQIKLEKSININAKPDKIWDALTNKKIVAQYFWGAEVNSEWKKGGLIVYTGTYDGGSYEDKGLILEIEVNTIIKHTYWTSFSEIPYDPETSSIITYQIDANSKNSKLTVIQEGFNNDDDRDKSLKNWEDILLNIKKIIESK